MAGIAADIPPVEVDDPDGERGSARPRLGLDLRRHPGGDPRVRAQGHPVAQAHLRHLNPFPSNLGEVLRRYPKMLVPEMNLGQLVKLVRADFLVDAKGLNKVLGKPFRAGEIEQRDPRPHARPRATPLGN